MFNQPYSIVHNRFPILIMSNSQQRSIKINFILVWICFLYDMQFTCWLICCEKQPNSPFTPSREHNWNEVDCKIRALFWWSRIQKSRWTICYKPYTTCEKRSKCTVSCVCCCVPWERFAKNSDRIWVYQKGCTVALWYTLSTHFVPIYTSFQKHDGLKQKSTQFVATFSGSVLSPFHLVQSVVELQLQKPLS